MTVEEAKAKIFHWLCSRYHDPGQGNEYIDKDIVRDAINIPEEVLDEGIEAIITFLQGETEDQTFSLSLRFDPNPSTMGFNDLFYESQSQTGPLC